MKKLILIFITLLLAACATPQASADTQVTLTLTVPVTATPTISQPTETPTITSPSAQFEEIKWTAFSFRSNKLAIFASQPGQENGGSLCVYQINQQTSALEQLWGAATSQDITSITLSPNGNLLIAILNNNFIVWIDANNGQFLHIFRGAQQHPNPYLLPDGYYFGGAWDVAFSPDGETLAVLTGNSSSALTLYNTATAEIEQIVTINQPSYVQDVAFSADSTILAASLYNNVIYTWSLPNKAPTHRLNIPTKETGIAKYLALSPDGNLVAFGATSDGKVLVWDIAKGQQLFVLSVGTAEQYYWNKRDLAFSPNGKTLITAAPDNLIVWDVITGKQLRVLPGNDKSDFVFSPDGKVLLVSDHASLLALDTTDGALLSNAALPKSGKITTNTFQSIPNFGSFYELFAFALTLPPRQIDSIKMIDSNFGWGNATNGRIYRTTDGGQHWQDVNPDDRWYTWDDIFALDADHAWAATNDREEAIWRTSDGGKTWEKPQDLSENAAYPNYTISLRFFDTQNGWFLGADQGNHGDSIPFLSKTGDGGKTWETIGFETAFGRYTGIFSYDKQTGFMNGVRGAPLDSFEGLPVPRDFIDGKKAPTIQKTTDGGKTWTILSLPRLSPIPEKLQALYSSDAQMDCGVLSLGFDHDYSRRITATVECEVDHQGSFNFYYFSDNGGQKWYIWQPAPEDFVPTEYINALVGWRQIKAQDGQIYHLQQTLDGGQTWNTIGDTAWEANTLEFVNEQIGWAMTYRGDFTVLFHTTDGGKTWEELKPAIANQ